MLNKIEYILINFGYLAMPDTLSTRDKRSLFDYLWSKFYHPECYGKPSKGIWNYQLRSNFSSLLGRFERNLPLRNARALFMTGPLKIPSIELGNFSVSKLFVLKFHFWLYGIHSAIESRTPSACRLGFIRFGNSNSWIETLDQIYVLHFRQ